MSGEFLSGVALGSIAASLITWVLMERSVHYWRKQEGYWYNRCIARKDENAELQRRLDQIRDVLKSEPKAKEPA